ncbi:MAG: zinc-ribbon domain-containing protein [Desulfobacterales bacterium]|nr:zinc-ribbon domain-containing protein [Desulfobacterales bacterium]
MITQCPHCSSPLKFSDAHKEKLVKALDNLAPGRSLKFGCPKCKTPIELDKSGNPLSKDQNKSQTKSQAPPAKQEVPGASKSIVPPNAPDIDWLTDGEREEADVIEDVPTAMVLVDDTALREKTVAALTENQYQIVVPENVDAAIDSMRFKDYAVVTFLSTYGGGALQSQDFHKFMMNMSMKKRRNIFYTLIGPEFSTLYDLQALTFSANLVVNTAQMDHFSTLIKKGMKDYEALFAPYLSALKQHGKN